MSDITTEQWKNSLLSPQAAEFLLEDLRAMRALLAPPGSWVQHSGAVGEHGQALNPVNSFATGWCLWGAAVVTAYKSDRKGNRAAIIQEYLELFTGNLTIAEWNDREDRTQDQVQDFLDIAIEELEELLPVSSRESTYE